VHRNARKRWNCQNRNYA